MLVWSSGRCYTGLKTRALLVCISSVILYSSSGLVCLGSVLVSYLLFIALWCQMSRTSDYQTSFFAVYNIETTELLAFYQANALYLLTYLLGVHCELSSYKFSLGHLWLNTTAEFFRGIILLVGAVLWSIPCTITVSLAHEVYIFVQQ